MNDTGRLLERVAETAVEDGMPEPAAVRARGTRRTRHSLAAGTALVAATVAMAGLVTVRSGDRTPPPAGQGDNTLQGWHLDETASIPGSGSVSIGKDGFVWVSTVDEHPGSPPGTLQWFDPVGLAQQGSVEGAGGSLPLFVGGNLLWQVGAEDSDEVWVAGGSAMTTFQPSHDRRSTQTGIVSANGSIYVTNNEPGTLSRLDKQTGRVLFERHVAAPDTLGPLASDGTHLFVGAGRDVLVLDATGNLVDRVTLDGPVSSLVYDTGRLVVGTRADHLAVLDVATPDDVRVLREGQVYRSLDTSLTDVAVAGGFVWAIAVQTEQLVQLDADTLAVRGTAKIAEDRRALLPSDLAVGAGSVWVRTVGGLLKFSPE